MSPDERRRVRALVRDLQWRAFRYAIWAGATCAHGAWGEALATNKAAADVAKLLDHPGRLAD